MEREGEKRRESDKERGREGEREKEREKLRKVGKIHLNNLNQNRYSRHAPTKSFIHVDNFASPHEFAKYLLYTAWTEGERERDRERE